jgi:PAS domain S-box-containing protein
LIRVADINPGTPYWKLLTMKQISSNTVYHEGWWAFTDLLPDPAVVLNADLVILHCNPVFEKTFGWALDEMIHRHFFSIFDDPAKKVIDQLYPASSQTTVQGVNTQLSAKDGQNIDVTLDAAVLPDSAGPGQAGIVMTLRNQSFELRGDRSRQILLRMSKALHRYRRPDRLLNYVTRLIQVMIGVEGASIIFLDPEKKEFYFHMASFEDTATERHLTTIRFPADKGVAGEVYRTGHHLVVADYAASPYAYKAVDEQAQFETRNLLDVPLRIKDRIIGVICAVNKRDGSFDNEDVELLCAIADMIALPIENNRVNQALQASCERLQSLNEDKERVVVHLAHELKTPLAVLSASIQLLERSLSAGKDQSWKGPFERAQRSLQRLLEMEYAVEDILRRNDQTSFDKMTRLPQTETPEPVHDADARFFQQVNIEFLIHELKGPISVIETNTHMLDGMHNGNLVPEERAMRLLQRILRAAGRVRALLEELLEVGRAESVCFNCSPFEPLTVVSHVLIETVESHAVDVYEKMALKCGVKEKLAFLASSGIRLEAQPAAARVAMVHDEVKFRQIVANLLKNALSYRRRLLLIHLTMHKDVLSLSVRDDGPGVSDEHKEKIFERYTQASPFPGVARSGHGLGLAVSRILARSMDGDITLESQLGQGAVFRLSLPLVFDRG